MIEGRWDIRFEQIEIVALMDLNRIVDIMNKKGFAFENVQNVSVDKRLIQLLDTDIRAVISWDMDLVDVEFCCKEPTGETCNAFKNVTRIGGTVSKNMTNGYGPQEYLIRKAPPGSYEIFVNLFSPKPIATMGGDVTVSCKITINFGRYQKEEEVISVVRLNQPKQLVKVAEIAI